MRTHTLKCWPEFFDAVRSGDKNFEVRKHDRDFQIGDVVLLRRFDPDNPDTGENPAQERRRISYVLTGGRFGIEPGYVVLGLERVPSAAERAARLHQDP